MVAWKMSTVIVTGRGINPHQPNPQLGIAPIMQWTWNKLYILAIFWKWAWVKTAPLKSAGAKDLVNFYWSLWMPLKLRTAAGRKMVAWKMSTVIVAGKGYQGLLSKPPFGYAKQLNSPIPRSNKQKDTVYEYPSFSWKLQLGGRWWRKKCQRWLWSRREYTSRVAWTKSAGRISSTYVVKIQ